MRKIFVAAIFLISFVNCIYASEKKVEPVKITFTKKITIDENIKIPKNSLCSTLNECNKLSNEYIDKISDLYYSSDVEESNIDEGDSSRMEDIENRIDLGVVNIKKDDSLSKIKFKLNKSELSNLKKAHNVFVKIVPRKWRKKVNKILVYKNNFSAAFASGDTLGVNVDINYDSYSLISTLVHELAHFFSMDEKQRKNVKWVEETEYKDSLYEYKKDSYLNRFYETFYVDIPRVWRNNTNKSKKDFNDFYELNSDNYVSDYAVNNYDEDFAESFKDFVLNYLPDTNLGKDKKLKFFYQFPELILLRTQILKNIVDNKLFLK